VLEVLKQVGLKKLDYLVVTHYHSDHYGGTADIAGHRLGTVRFMQQFLLN
jgi:beta-lactamase superfamily II metal-dependent hydrolase